MVRLHRRVLLVRDPREILLICSLDQPGLLLYKIWQVVEPLEHAVEFELVIYLKDNRVVDGSVLSDGDLSQLRVEAKHLAQEEGAVSSYVVVFQSNERDGSLFRLQVPQCMS